MRKVEAFKRALRLLLVMGALFGGLIPHAADAYQSQVPVEFSEDGRVLLVQWAGELVVWDLEARALVAKVPRVQCNQITLLKQDGWVLCTGDGVIIYDWKRQITVASIPKETQNPVRLLAYSRESDRIVIRQGNDAVSVWQLGEKLVPLKNISINNMVSVVASPDTKTLAIAQGQKIRLHDLQSTHVRDVAIKEGQPRDLLFSPNSSMLAASIGNTILLVDANSGSIHARATLTSAERARGHLTPRTFSHDSRHLVAGNGEWSFPLFDADTGKLLSLTEFTYADQEHGVQSYTQLHAVDISADGDYLVGQPEHPYTLQVWDLRTGSMLPDLCGEDCRNMGPQVSLLKWSPTGSKIVVAMQGTRNAEVNGKISVWDVKSRMPELVLDASQPQAKVLAKRSPIPATVAATPAPKPVVPSAPATGQAFAHELAIRALAMSPTANLLVTTSDDRTLKVWDPGQGTLLRQLKLSTPATALAFSADGTILAAGSTIGEIRLWETQTWREFPPYSSRQGSINALHFLPGNKFLVIAGGQPTVPVVNLSTREVVKELVHTTYYQMCDTKGCQKKRSTQGDVVSALSFVEDRNLLLTTSRTGHVVWDAASWTEMEQTSLFPEAWSGLGWKRKYVNATTRTNQPNALALTLWDMQSNSALTTLESYTYSDTHVVNNGMGTDLGTSLALDAQGRWVATRVGERITVWDLQTQAKKKVFYTKMPRTIEWTSDGRHLIVSTLDRKVLVWSADTMEPAHYLRDPAVLR